MKKIFTFLLLFTLFGAVAELQAQNRFAVTLQGGFSTGAYEATNTGIGSGSFTFRANLSYAVLPVLDAYAAYTHAGFTCGPIDESVCSERVGFTTSGFNAGLRLNRASEANKWVPWLRAGLVYQTLEYSQEKNENYSNSGIGFEVGAGLAYPVTEHIEIVPSVNYTRYSIEGANGVKNTVVIINGLLGLRFEF